MTRDCVVYLFRYFLGAKKALVSNMKLEPRMVTIRKRFQSRTLESMG